jgi:hypothetical protein
MDQRNKNQSSTEDKVGKKTSQEFLIKDFPNLQFYAGTMDRTTYKGCFLEIKGHFTSKEENHTTMMRKVLNQLKNTLERNLDKELFREQFIMTTDISESFVATGSSYTKLEFTLFPKRKTNKQELTLKLNEICDKVYQQAVVDNRYMDFNKQIKRGKNGK